MKTSIWRHTPSGDYYAVARDSYSLILGARGPLRPADIPAVLTGDWESDANSLAWLTRNVAAFQDVTAQVERE